MKKTVISVLVVSVFLSPIVSWAEEIFCICGNKAWKTESGLPEGWSHVRDPFIPTAYLCPNPQCLEKAKKMREKNYKEYAETGDNIAKNANDVKKQLVLIAKSNDLFIKALLASRQEQDVPRKQIRLMNEIIKKANLTDFWESFASYADMKAIVYFWPDPENEEVYLSSKRREKQIDDDEIQEYKKLLSQIQEAKRRGDTRMIMELRKKITFKPDGSVVLGGKIRTATKTEPAAFALGVSKKDNSIRYVERDRFSNELLYAVIRSGRTDVFSYLVKQCGGMSGAFQTEMIKQWTRANAQVVYDQFMLDREIKLLEASKDKAEDKFEIKEIDSRISAIKAKKQILNSAISSEIAAFVLHGTKQDQLVQILSDEELLREQYNPPATMEDAYIAIRSLEQHDLDAVADAVGANKALNQEEIQALRKIYFITLASQMASAFEKENPTFTKWLQWRKDMLANWKPFVPDPWVPTQRTAETWNRWEKIEAGNIMNPATDIKAPDVTGNNASDSNNNSSGDIAIPVDVKIPVGNDKKADVKVPVKVKIPTKFGF